MLRYRYIILVLSHRWHGKTALLIDFIDQFAFQQTLFGIQSDGVNFASSD